MSLALNVRRHFAAESVPTLLIGTSSAPAAILQTDAIANADVTTALPTNSTTMGQESCSIAYDCRNNHSFVWSDQRGENEKVVSVENNCN